jgi:hypothetical protein
MRKKMEALFVPYDGNDFNQAIEEARRRHPNHIGAVIAIPRGLERQGFFESLTRGLERLLKV